MEFFRLVKRETSGQRLKIAISAAISGVANAAILGVINTASELVEDKEQTLPYLVMFIAAISLYAYCLKYTYDKSTALFEKILHKIRIRITREIKDSELSSMEKIGRESIYNRLTQEVEVISQSQHSLVGALQALVMLFFSAIYVFILSPIAFVIILVLYTTMIFLYTHKQTETTRLLRASAEKSDELIRLVIHLLDGFKQIRTRAALGNSLQEDIESVSNQNLGHKIQAANILNGRFVLAMSVSYIILGAIVFVLPSIVEAESQVINELSSAVLFIFGPIGMIVGAVPVLQRANVAAQNIRILEESLRNEVAESTDPSGPAIVSEKIIEMKNAYYYYKDKDGKITFPVGPVDLTIHKGEMLFIIGGNGSGKSTMLKMLTGLYVPDEGHIEVDGKIISAENRQNYREMFSIIFGDFHLFDKLYGMDDVTRDTVIRLLRDMEIEDKTDYDGEYFTKLELSTGQRKRIALLVSLLEDRPVYIFDEWAADQDPQFRKHFYLELLPALVKRGKTVIAVTHDDHYFHVPDRIMKFDYGTVDYINTVDKNGPKSGDSL